MAVKRKKRPRDPLQLAKLIGDIATGQTQDQIDDGKDAAASELGRLGGLKGGRARAKSLSKKARKAIATKAARARWEGRRKQA